MSDTTGTQGADPSSIELLASAYLDGEVTGEERAQVESSSELLAEVERLRQVRAVLGATTEPPAISVRESHLAAALDVWDRMPETERSGEVTTSAGMDAAAAAAISTPAPTSLNARRDRRSGGGSTKWLMGAAAGLAVIAGAGVVLQGLGSSEDDDSAADSVLTEAPAEEPASEPDVIAEMAVDEFTGEEAESAPITVNADDIASADDRVESEPEEEPADEPAEEAAAPADAEPQEAMEEEAMEEAPANETSNPAEDAASPEIDLFELLTPEDLADFGAIAFYAPVDAEAPADPDIEPTFNTCEIEFAGTFAFDAFAGLAFYQGELVVVAVDSGADPASVIAFTQICEFVASVPLPPEDEFNNRVATETVLDQP